MRKLLYCVLLASLTAAAGCGSSSHEGHTAAPAPATASAPTSASPPAAGSGANSAGSAAATKPAETAKPAEQPKPEAQSPAKAEAPKAEPRPAPAAPAASPEPAKAEAPKAEPLPAPAAPAASPEPAKPAAEPAGTVDLAAKAMPIYKDNCMACHGDQLQGGFGPNLTKVGSKRTKQAIVDQINKGSGKMPGFGSVLKPDQVEALAAWLAEKK